MKVTDNHFASNFFFLDARDSGFRITSELSFQEGEFIFDELPFTISGFVEITCHFLKAILPDEIIIP